MNTQNENSNKFFSRFLINYGQELVLLASIIILFVVVSQVNHRFLGGNNLNTIFAGNAYIGVAAIGMSILIITGNIDVSVGALIGVLATIAFTCVFKAYSSYSISVISIFEYSLIIWSIIIGYFLFDDTPTIKTVIGCIMVIGAGIFIFFREKIREQKTNLETPLRK